MNKLIKISQLLIVFSFLCSCGSVGEVLQGKKRSDQGDEFLIDKKNPLVMPPYFDKLPKPGETIIKSSKDIQSDQSNIENLIKNSDDVQTSSSNEVSTSIESSILKKIK